MPWGDGKHTLFFNEEALPLPGKGYIREEELHVPILITLRNLFNMKARWNTKVGDEPSHGWKPITINELIRDHDLHHNVCV